MFTIESWLMENAALYHAVVENDPLALTELLQLGGNVDEFFEDTMNISSKSLLHVCCGKGHAECLKVLIDFGAQLDVRDKWGQTPLMYCSSIQYPEAAKLLLEADTSIINIQDRFGKSPLHSAVEVIGVEMVELLLKFGADVNIRDHEGWSPLMVACSKPSSEDMIQILKLLLKAGAIVELLDYRGKRSALHVAVVAGNVHAVEILLATGADINEMDKTLRTPLTHALYSGVRGPEVSEVSMELVSLLVSMGAKIDMNKTESCSPLLSSALLKSEQMVRYFLALGADPNLTFPSGVTASLVCASTGDLNSLKTLIYYNCCLTIKGSVYKRRLRCEFSLDPFQLAYMEGYLNLCVLMVQAGYSAGEHLKMISEDLDNLIKKSDLSENSANGNNVRTVSAKESVLQWLVDSCHSPRSLMEASIFVIRKSLGRRLVNSVETLPLPASVKRAVLLKDILS